MNFTDQTSIAYKNKTLLRTNRQAVPGLCINKSSPPQKIYYVLQIITINAFLVLR